MNKDSSIMREMKATSPPGVTISLGEPVHAVNGGRCFDAAEEINSSEEE